MSRFATFIVFATSLLMSTVTVAQERAILVLDGSGSMWGQIDGEAKITIAQRVIADLLVDLPESTQLGLTAYGHREKGNCADIETLVLPGADTRGDILTAVNAVSPKGKTPLSAAVLAAAEVLKYEEDKATVILISDGRETCDYDPCALGNELEATGVDFTAHVVGFDVENDPEAKAQLQCLADNTGGRFLPAANADELSEALTEISAPIEPVFYQFDANARIENDGPYILEDLTWEVYDRNDLSISFDSQEADIVAELESGEYRVTVIRGADDARASLEFFIEDAPKSVVLELPELPLEGSVEAPETAPVGSEIMVTWDGPGAEYDYVLITQVGTDDNDFVNYTYVSEGNPLPLTMAPLPGDYEIRYFADESSKAIASTPITLTPVDAAIIAPDTAAAGEDLVIEWEGPDYEYDYISIAALDAENSGYINYTYTYDGSPTRLLMPADAGTYEIRYVMGQADTVLATHPITVEEVSATLDAPETAVAGEDVVIEWVGPNYDLDYIAVFSSDDPDARYINYTYTRDGSPLRLAMPVDAGEYEIRYIQNQDSVSLATSAITVTEVAATLTIPETAIAGEDILVEWEGPGYDLDYIAVFEANADFDARYINYSYARDGSPLELTMPTEPGEYEVRYILNQDRKSIGSATITVTDVSASITIPETAAAGSELTVTWEGPDYDLDYIAVFEGGADFDARYINYTYTRDGSPLKLTMPTEPGEYEVRYILNQDRESLTATPITVTAVSAELTVPPTAAAGDNIVVEWQGPDYDLDYIAVFEADSDFDAKYINYTYTRDGSPLRLEMPTEPGDYEIRYIVNQDRSTLASATITLEAVSASLTLPPEAHAGETIVLEWEGPDYRNDYIAVFPDGSDDARYVNYTRTSDGSPLRLLMPAEPGTYEVRYILDQDRTALARASITLSPVSATISAAATAPAGERIVVEFEGPENRNDYIGVFPAGSPDDARYSSYTRVQDGSPIRVAMPDEPGEYELRYIMNQNTQVLGRLPITVE